ncbi:luciferin sulfotransferase-like [Chrysoperla carnea]|uniref:luciferin sulfotransferase-like n=1 Tax=Chrysoperla carnea TaxID=189513 RepID=UPI001D093464|nr:luciferin sulfotransferase-like [Chrysoperla carnea]XP_044742538.1 luciferin sulfotransferase-like [Chrysoperla carnea]
MPKITKINPQQTKLEADEQLWKYFVNDFRKGYVEVTDKKFILPEYYVEFMDKIENFEVFDTDVFVITHPKTGTTWIQEMVWCLGHNLEVSDVFLPKRFPFLEVTTMFDIRECPEQFEEFAQCEFFTNSLEYTKNLPQPRYIKTHLPWDLLPKQIRTGERNPKIIYVYRNPKDTSVSYYHHCRNGEGYAGDFNVFMELFLNGRLAFGPYPAHVLSIVEQKQRDNVLIVKYEDMKSDLKSVIKQVMAFLNQNYSDEEISILEKHLSFESMKNNSAVNYDTHFKGGTFMRAGVIGSYNSDMTPELIKRFDKWTVDNFGHSSVLNDFLK